DFIDDDDPAGYVIEADRVSLGFRDGMTFAAPVSIGALHANAATYDALNLRWVGVGDVLFQNRLNIIQTFGGHGRTVEVTVDNPTLHLGTVLAESSVLIDAKRGSIVQIDGGSLSAPHAELLASDGDISLRSGALEAGTLSLHASGDVLADHSANRINTIALLTAENAVIHDSDDDLTLQTALIGEGLTLMATGLSGVITGAGGTISAGSSALISAEGIKLDSGTVSLRLLSATVSGDLSLTNAGALTLSALGDMSGTLGVSADGDLGFNANHISVGGGFTLRTGSDSDDDLTLSGHLTGAGTATLTAGGGVSGHHIRISGFTDLSVSAGSRVDLAGFAGTHHLWAPTVSLSAAQDITLGTATVTQTLYIRVGRDVVHDPRPKPVDVEAVHEENMRVRFVDLSAGRNVGVLNMAHAQAAVQTVRAIARTLSINTNELTLQGLTATRAHIQAEELTLLEVTATRAHFQAEGAIRALSALTVSVLNLSAVSLSPSTDPANPGLVEVSLYDITATHARNTIGTLLARGRNIRISNSGDLAVPTIHASGQLALSVGGDIRLTNLRAQTASLSGSGDITLVTVTVTNTLHIRAGRDVIHSVRAKPRPLDPPWAVYDLDMRAPFADISAGRNVRSLQMAHAQVPIQTLRVIAGGNIDIAANGLSLLDVTAGYARFVAGRDIHAVRAIRANTLNFLAETLSIVTEATPEYGQTGSILYNITATQAGNDIGTLVARGSVVRVNSGADLTLSEVYASESLGLSVGRDVRFVNDNIPAGRGNAPLVSAGTMHISAGRDISLSEDRGGPLLGAGTMTLGPGGTLRGAAGADDRVMLMATLLNLRGNASVGLQISVSILSLDTGGHRVSLLHEENRIERLVGTANYLNLSVVNILDIGREAAGGVEAAALSLVNRSFTGADGELTTTGGNVRIVHDGLSTEFIGTGSDRRSVIHTIRANIYSITGAAGAHTLSLSSRLQRLHGRGALRDIDTITLEGISLDFIDDDDPAGYVIEADRVSLGFRDGMTFAAPV
ncbi:MAG: hypothetical protein ISN29_08235, partial [Gammaproteobacteria bacterium AqS3]|nr:hypothetical protein [Gammaproteobacteria bacterium AqS3]